MLVRGNKCLCKLCWPDNASAPARSGYVQAYRCLPATSDPSQMQNNLTARKIQSFRPQNEEVKAPWVRCVVAVRCLG